ncbi:pilin [Microbulbifer marinus]|nr:pilin [Microbulbifer marinus]
MVVVAIIGILAAVALPAYQDYAARTRVSEGLALATEVKALVADNASTAAAAAGGGLGAGFPTSAVAGGPTVPCSTAGICVQTVGDNGVTANTSPNVLTLSVNTATGQIDVAFSLRVNAAGANVLSLVPTSNTAPLVAGVRPISSIVWTCYAAGRAGNPGTGTLPANLAPAECRG